MIDTTMRRVELMRHLSVISAVVACGGVLTCGALAVTGGRADFGHSYVGAVVQQQTRSGITATELCSGFLYDQAGARLATAAHCFPDGSTVYVDFAQAPDPPNFVNGVPTSAGWLRGVVHDDPAYCAGCGQAGGPAHDVATVALEKPQPQQGYANLPAPGADVSLSNNDPIDVVGYGLQSVSKSAGPGAYGARRTATTAVKNVTSDYVKLAADPGACEGDSGGPDLEQGTDTAVALNTFSNGNPNCNGVTYSIRLDDPAIVAFLVSLHE